MNMIKFCVSFIKNKNAINMNLSHDIGVSHNDQPGLCPTYGDIKSLGVTEEAQGMLLIKSNHNVIGSHLKQQRSKLNTIKFIP